MWLPLKEKHFHVAGAGHRLGGRLPKIPGVLALRRTDILPTAEALIGDSFN